MIPIINRPGTASNNWNGTSAIFKIGVIISISFATMLAVIEEREMDVSARIEKCRIIISCANIMPAIGALNTDDIAAATPAPIMISCGMLSINFLLLIYAAQVAPKWTNGPYNPTEAPPLIEKKETIVDVKPNLISSVPPFWCAA